MMIFTRSEFDCVVEVSLDLPAREKGSFNSTLKPRAKVVFRLTVLNIVCDSPIPNSFNLYIFNYKYSHTRKLRAKHQLITLVQTSYFDCSSAISIRLH